MNKLIALLITFTTGLLFLLGILIVKKVNNKKNVYEFATSLAFSVIICLLLFDIIPEIISSFAKFTIIKKAIYILAYILIGIIILKMLDSLVPAHNHNHHDNEKNVEEHNNHLFHVGIITTLALFLHNIIEGMAIYSISLSSLKSGILMALGISLHNIPMGMEIYLTIDLAKKEKINKLLTYLLLVISPLIGGGFMLLFNRINNVILGMLMSITAGMLIYISFFELFKEVKENIKEKQTIWGIVVGIVLMFITIII